MKDLPGGQIVPAARPVDAFIRPAQLQARAGLPQLRIGAAPQINTIQRASGGDVRGFNQWAQLADALAPFNNALMKTATSGGELYAQSEYEKGRNEAIKAQILANQQRLQGGAAYSAETRRLEGVDPEAARMMDRVNPFRQAGRDNQRARMAANEAKTYILQSYRDTPGAETWKPGDPRLAELKVKSTQELLKWFGLDQSSAGFQDYVNPEITQAWDRVSTEQYGDHQSWAEDTIPRLTAVEMLQQFSNARATGTVEWVELDPATQQPVRRQARLGDPEFNYGVSKLLGQTLGRIQGEVGLRGKSTEAMRKAYLQLVEMAGIAGMAPTTTGDERDALKELVSIAQGLEVGPPRKDGKRATLAELFAPETYDLAKELRKDAFDQQALVEAQALRELGDLAATTILQAAPGTPEYEKAVEALRERGRQLNVPADKVLDIIGSVTSKVNQIGEHSSNTASVEEFLGSLQDLDPAGFNRDESLAALKAGMAGWPDSLQAKYLKQFAQIAESKSKEGQNSKGAVINPILTKGIRAALEREYAQDIAQAALRGVKDIADFMAMNDPNMRTSAARLEEGARKHMQNRLAEAAQKAGRRLSAAEETAVATQAFNEYLNTKDQNLKDYLYPGGLNGGPSVPGGRATQPAPNTRGQNMQTLPPGRKPNPVPVVSSSNLDNVDAKVLQSGAVVLRKPDTLNEIERVLLGQTPSAAVQRAARAAGMPVGQWLLKQAEGYPGSVTPTTRKELLKRTNQGQAAGQKVSQAGKPGSPFGAGSMWLADILMGTRPAMASQGGGGSRFPFTRNQFPAGTAGRGGDIQGVYRQGGWGPKGRNQYGDHHDIKRVDGGRFERNALDRYVLVDGQPLSRGRTVKGGEFGASRDGGTRTHTAWDYAFQQGKGNLTLTGGARWIGVTKGSYGDEARFRTPDGKVYRIIHGNFSRGGNQGGRPMPTRGTLTGKATYYTGSGGSDGVLGGKTANGETFTGKQMTAAVQWSLKPKWMNKWLVVEDTRTGRRIRVWANDTGQMGGTKQRPADRLIDLSPVAFTKLFGSTRQGVGNIRVTVDPNQRGRP